MASLKEVKNRINSVKSTRQITSAMKMVSSAKLHKAQARIESMLPYQRRLSSILTNFMSADDSFQTPIMEVRPVSKVAIVVFSSNSSLCGAFNSNIAKRLEAALHDYAHLKKEDIFIYPVGKKVEEAVRKWGYAPAGSFQDMADKPNYAQASELATRLMKDFVERKIDRVELIYHHFKSMGTQVLTRENYLPIDLKNVMEEDEKAAKAGGYINNYIVEPSVPELMTELLPKVVCQKLYTVLADSNASEHAARMLAMQAATDNANELIQDLTKQYNKSRQQAITNELLDIIGGTLK